MNRFLSLMFLKRVSRIVLILTLVGLGAFGAVYCKRSYCDVKTYKEEKVTVTVEQRVVDVNDNLSHYKVAHHTGFFVNRYKLRDPKLKLNQKYQCLLRSKTRCDVRGRLIKCVPKP